MQTEKLKYIWEVFAGQRARILLNCFTGMLEVAFSLAFIYAYRQVSLGYGTQPCQRFGTLFSVAAGTYG